MLNQNITKLFRNDWLVALFIFAVFFLTNGYTYAWDDQHLEIPLLKSLIDSELYAGDYYVESLKKTFTSFLYPILAKVITVSQIPSAYFILYLVARYFLFFWIYKLWVFIAKDRTTALFCSLMIILLGRVEELLYRTFSHQEFALAIIFAGIYFFYKNRFLLAAAIFGIASNFHALYSMYPMFYMLCYIVWEYGLVGRRSSEVDFKTKREGAVVLIKSGVTFLILMAPLLIWTFTKPAPIVEADKNWIQLYLLACPQNFLFNQHALKDILTDWKIFTQATWEYWIILVFFLLNFFHNELFRKDHKALVIMTAATGLLLFSFIFSYIIPNRFVLDLNLVRNIQFMLFFLMGYTVILIAQSAERHSWITMLLIALVFPLIRFGQWVMIYTGCFIFFLLALQSSLEKEGAFSGKRLGSTLFFFTGLTLSVFGLAMEFFHNKYSFSVWVSFIVIAVLLLTNFILYLRVNNAAFKKAATYLIFAVPFFVLTVNSMYYHFRHLQIEKSGSGFWQIQRNWIDMQKYVKKHVPKQALLLVPHDMEMGGFRIFSERKVLVCYRDCGIVGFDYNAAKEWQKRLSDVDAFQVMIRKPLTPAIQNAVVKYRVNYIVFMSYVAPPSNELLERLYENEAFVLYRVKTNPVKQLKN